MGSFAIPSLSELGLWRRGSSGEPGAPERRLNTVARAAAAPAMARQRAGHARERLKTALINHPVLRFAASGVTVAGFVELREESQHTDRFVLRVDRIDGGRIEEPPWRVRLSVKRGMAPPAGSFVEVKASLEPPLQPLEPGRKRANDSPQYQ